MTPAVVLCQLFCLHFSLYLHDQVGQHEGGRPIDGEKGRLVNIVEQDAVTGNIFVMLMDAKEVRMKMDGDTLNRFIREKIKGW